MPFNKATSHVHEWIVFVYLRRLPEDERRGNGSIPACRFDVVCRIKPAHTPSSNTSCCFTDFSVEVNYRSALKRQHGGRMHEGERSDYWVWKDTHTYRERESSGECLKSGWQSSLSLRYLSSLHASCSSHLPCSSSFAKSFFPQMLAHHFFFSCLVLLSLSLSVCQSLSLHLTAVPHICSAAQRPQRQKDVCAYTCECYMAKSMWTLLVSGFFHNWGSTA